MSAERYDEGQLVAEIPRGDRDVYRIRACEYRGAKYVDLRIFYAEQPGGELKPGKGVTIRPAALGDVIKALQLAAPLLGVRTG